MEKQIHISPYLTEKAQKTIDLMLSAGKDRETIIGEDSFFVAAKKEDGCIAKIKHGNRTFYLHQKF